MNKLGGNTITIRERMESVNVPPGSRPQGATLQFLIRPMKDEKR
jgi:hypothetical protein